MSIEISNETEYDIDLQEVDELARFVMNALFISPFSDLMITFVEPGAIEELHIRWLGLAGPTDVMSFPMDELRPGSSDNPTGPGNLGDIVVCPLVAAAQARKAGHSTREEILLLITHSLLHLVGYDHATPVEEADMFSKQRKLTLAFLSTRNSGAQNLPSFTDFSHLISHESTDPELFKREEAAWLSAHNPSNGPGLTSANLTSGGTVKIDVGASSFQSSRGLNSESDSSQSVLGSVAGSLTGPLGSGQGIEYLDEVASSGLDEGPFQEDFDDDDWPEWPDDDELDEESAAGVEWLQSYDNPEEE